jgi:hypothetical protein
LIERIGFEPEYEPINSSWNPSCIYGHKKLCILPQSHQDSKEIETFKMNFGEKAIQFYRGLKPPPMRSSDGIGILNPLKEKNVRDILETFYQKYYQDEKKRIFLIGINPGRFGGGITGIPFTDPVNLQEVLGIPNRFEKKHELSSRFVYEVIERMGGAQQFFSHCYLTAVSPYGFVRGNKNLNYYDDKYLWKAWEPFLVEWLKQQIEFGANQEIAFSLGKGKNLEYLNKLNEKHDLFHQIGWLPHPRWVMQYRYKKRNEFFKIYTEKLNSFIFS